MFVESSSLKLNKQAQTSPNMPKQAQTSSNMNNPEYLAIPRTLPRRSRSHATDVTLIEDGGPLNEG